MAKFFLLLTAALLVSVAQTLAVPTAKPQAGSFTMKIHSLHGLDRQDVHPQIQLQQHINRGERRFARVAGHPAPSDDELGARLVKRMAMIDNGSVVPRDQSQRKAPMKRYNSASVMFDGLKESTSVASDQGEDPEDFADILADMLAGHTSSGVASMGLSIFGPDVGYIGRVKLGTPPTTFRVLMDSGSGDFWVGSESCSSVAGGDCGRTHRFLGSQSSSSFVDTGVPFEVTYGTGNVSGTIVTDDLIIAGLHLKNHAFGVATLETPDFANIHTAFDGLMGLSQAGLSQQGKPTPVESLAEAGLISAAITSYKIPRLADHKDDGEITFGDLDRSKFDPETLVTVPNVNKQGFWEAKLDAITVDGQNVGLERNAVLDTGTTLILVPVDDAAVIHKFIDGAKPDGNGGFTVPCNMKQSISLSVGGRDFPIDPRDMAFMPLDGAKPDGDCTSGIVGIAGVLKPTTWLVGDVFLKNAYFSTDLAKSTVSLAKLV